MSACLCAAAITASGVAHGHTPHTPGPETLKEHIDEDAVALSPAQEARFERTTAAVTAPDSKAALRITAAEDPGQVGQWGPVVDWPVVGIHAALLPNGKVLAYDSNIDPANNDQTYTRATVWDPKTGEQTPATAMTGVNIFCSGLAHLADGALFLAGGNKNDQFDGIAQTHIFDGATNAWTRTDDMAYERWYPTVTPLQNEEMLITEGGPDIPEVRETDGDIRALGAASMDLPLYPWIDVAPDGRAFVSGPDADMMSLDPSGQGSWQSHGRRDEVWRGYGGHALFDKGKILVAGGGESTASALVIDLNGASPRVTETAPMANGRRQHNLTVLADGTVLATGGNSSGASLIDMDHGVYNAELWDPSTEQWRTLAAEQVTRQYHSTALLLPDGRILSAGGGVCGTCNEVGYLAQNAQVFSPPYLFKDDGSGEPAPRPAVTSAPGSISYGEPFDVETPDPSSISKVALLRLGAVTHSVNMEQRYLPLSFTADDGAVAAVGPANANVAPPGVYMLFVIDADGVPSVAEMVRVTSGSAAPPIAAPTITDTDPNSPANDNDPEVKGTAAAASTVKIYSTGDCSGSPLASGSASQFASPGITVAVDADRSTSLRATATDAGGVASACSSAFAYVEDSSAPAAPTIHSGPSGPTKDATPTFGFSAEAGTTVHCSIDRGTPNFVACASPYTPAAALADDSYTFRVRATDAAGNQATTTRSFSVDTRPPDTTITAGPAEGSFTRDSTPTFSFASTEAASKLQCKIDASSYASCSSPKTLAALGNGSHTFRVRATDGAGNIDASPAARTFIVDTAAPNTTITAGPAAGSFTRDSTPTFSFASTETGSKFQCQIDTSSYAGCSSPKTLTTLSVGSHTFRVRAIDRAGNVDASPAARTFSVKPQATTSARLMRLILGFRQARAGSR